MAWVFDNIVYVAPGDTHGDGMNTLFPDGHVRWHRVIWGHSFGEGEFAAVGPSSVNGRWQVHLWLEKYVDGDY